MSSVGESVGGARVTALPEQTEVAVVGGGVIGLAAAAHLARSGHRVVVLDAGEPGNAASTHNAGQFRPAACVPLAAPGAIREFARAIRQPGRPISLSPGAFRDWRWPLAFAGWTRPGDLERRIRVLAQLGHAGSAAYEVLEEWAGRKLLVRGGALDVYETAAGWRGARALADSLAERGFEAQPLSGEEVLGREPSLRPAPAGGVFFPGAAHCDPGAVVAALLDVAVAAGAKVVSGAEVTGIKSRGEHELLDLGGCRLRAESVVLAAGSRSRSLLAGESARSVPVLGGRGLGLDLATGPLLGASMIFAERHLAVTPLASGGVRLTTGMDVGGAGLRVRAARFRALQRAGEETLELPQSPTQERWVGIRPLTPDGLPLVGRLPGRERIVVATGHGMLGLTYGPATGELVSRLFDGELPAWAEALAPARFARGWSAGRVAG